MWPLINSNTSSRNLGFCPLTLRTAPLGQPDAAVVGYLSNNAQFRALALLGRLLAPQAVKHAADFLLGGILLASSFERAMVAARIATLPRGARTDLSPIGEKSQSQAAELLSISKRSVERAREVLDGAVPELIQAVERLR
jgi:hypothetical protein